MMVMTGLWHNILHTHQLAGSIAAADRVIAGICIVNDAAPGMWNVNETP